MDLAQHPTIAELTLIAKASLPRDIRVLWQHTFPTCAVIQVASPTIEKALGGQVGDPTGEVTIEFTSGGAGNGSSTNNSRNITTVIVLGAPASTLADFTGC